MLMQDPELSPLALMSTACQVTADRLITPEANLGMQYVLRLLTVNEATVCHAPRCLHVPYPRRPPTFMST